MGENFVLSTEVELISSSIDGQADSQSPLYNFNIAETHYITILLSYLVYPYVFGWKVDEKITLLPTNFHSCSLNTRIKLTIMIIQY